MAEPPDDLKELKLKIVELENQLREFVDPPELSEEEIKAYKKVKAAVEFGARGCYVCMAAAAACSRSCLMAETLARGPCYYCAFIAEPSAMGCSRSCLMADPSAMACRGCSCLMSDPSAMGCSRSCLMSDPSAMGCSRSCLMSDPSAMGCSRSCLMADPSAMACRGCAGCIAGHGTPGPKVGRGAVGRFASLAD